MEATLSQVEHEVRCSEYEAIIAEKEGRINALEFRLKQLEKLIFGTKSERTETLVAPEQMTLWEQDAPAEAPPGEKQKVSYERKKKSAHAGRQKLPDHLPVEEITLYPAEDTSGMRCIGREVTETLDYTPGSLRIKRIIRPVFARPEAEQTEDVEAIVVAPLPRRPIGKGIAEAGLLAHILVAKFVDHQPFYRQIKGFKRDYGWHPGRSTFSDWLAACCKLLDPLYQELIRIILETVYLQTDESPFKVLDSDKKGKSHRGYMWVYRAPLSGLILFDYRKGRGANGVLERLEHFTGYLQTDGYSAYKTYLRKHPEVTGISCLAHIRRKFVAARDNDRRRADLALAAINFIYHVEAHCRRRGRTAEQSLALRRRLSLPVYDALLDWVGFAHAGNLSTRACGEGAQQGKPMGKALHYAKNELPKLAAYFTEGYIEVDNNLIENSIRPLALGRKNYLFAGSHRGARQAAMMYSFFASCQRLDINPRVWLEDVLRRLPDHPINRIEELLPHRWQARK